MAIQPDRKGITASIRNYRALFLSYAYVAPNNELPWSATSLAAQKHCLQPLVIIPRPAKQWTLLWINLFIFFTMSPTSLLATKNQESEGDNHSAWTLAERQFEWISLHSFAGQFLRSKALGEEKGSAVCLLVQLISQTSTPVSVP